MEAKQLQIDTIQNKLREASAKTGEERRAFEARQERKRQREDRRLKLENLSRAAEEESVRLLQLQNKYNQATSNIDMHLGDADKALAPPTIPEDEVHKERSLQQLPSAHVLQARLNAYKANNDLLERSVRKLKSKDSGRIAKFKKIISLCTKVEIDKVDGVIEGLARAVNSERDIELHRVREFLSKVDGV